MPFLLETRVLPLPAGTTSRFRQTPVPSEKIVIDKVQINPKFEESLFARPAIETTAQVKH